MLQIVAQASLPSRRTSIGFDVCGDRVVMMEGRRDDTFDLIVSAIIEATGSMRPLKRVVSGLPYDAMNDVRFLPGAPGVVMILVHRLSSLHCMDVDRLVDLGQVHSFPPGPGMRTFAVGPCGHRVAVYVRKGTVHCLARHPGAPCHSWALVREVHNDAWGATIRNTLCFAPDGDSFFVLQAHTWRVSMATGAAHMVEHGKRPVALWGKDLVSSGEGAIDLWGGDDGGRSTVLRVPKMKASNRHLRPASADRIVQRLFFFQNKVQGAVGLWAGLQSMPGKLDVLCAPCSCHGAVHVP